jgi:hypothetical protein
LNCRHRRPHDSAYVPIARLGCIMVTMWRSRLSPVNPLSCTWEQLTQPACEAWNRPWLGTTGVCAYSQIASPGFRRTNQRRRRALRHAKQS